MNLSASRPKRLAGGGPLERRVSRHFADASCPVECDEEERKPITKHDYRNSKRQCD
jgi:hypothetical protein